METSVRAVHAGATKGASVPGGLLEPAPLTRNSSRPRYEAALAHGLEFFAGPIAKTTRPRVAQLAEALWFLGKLSTSLPFFKRKASPSNRTPPGIASTGSRRRARSWAPRISVLPANCAISFSSGRALYAHWIACQAARKNYFCHRLVPHAELCQRCGFRRVQRLPNIQRIPRAIE